MGKRKKEELPDYTVANMDVDGMPWNSRRPWQIFPGDPSKSRKEFDVKVPEPGMENVSKSVKLGFLSEKSDLRDIKRSD